MTLKTRLEVDNRWLRSTATHRSRMWLLVGMLAVSASGCAVTQDVARDTLPAKEPILHPSPRLHTWQGDDNFYSDSYHFKVDVERTWLNSISLLKDGLAVNYSESESVPASPDTYYRSSNTELNTAENWQKTAFLITQSVADQVHGTLRTYEFAEHSPNPAFRGTTNESKSTSMKVVAVRNLPTADLAFVMGSASPGFQPNAYSVYVIVTATQNKQWRLFQNRRFLQMMTAPGTSMNSSSKVPLEVSDLDELELEAINAVGQSVVARLRCHELPNPASMPVSLRMSCY